MRAFLERNGRILVIFAGIAALILPLAIVHAYTTNRTDMTIIGGRTTDGTPETVSVLQNGALPALSSTTNIAGFAIAGPNLLGNATTGTVALVDTTGGLLVKPEGGTAGSPSGNVVTVQGAAGMTQVETLDSLDMAVSLGAPTNTPWVSQISTVISSSIAASTCYRFSCNSAVNYRLSNGASAAVSTDNFLAANTPEKFCTNAAAITNLTVFPSTASGNCTITSLISLP